MAESKGSKVALVGIDGFSPVEIERYLTAGEMPALAAIRARGAAVSLVSTLPATTPVAWASVSTGCHPARSGIQNFLMPRRGRVFEERIPGVYARALRAEPIWKTAYLNGKRAFVVKFPVSYPCDELALRVDGAAGWGGITCLHECSAASVSTWPERFETLAPDWRGHPPLELENLRYALLKLPNIWGKAPVVVALAMARRGVDPVLAVAVEADWDAAVQVLSVGEMSAPLLLSAEGRRGREQHAVRFKPLGLSLEPPELRLFNTPVHALAGHSSPEATWRRHLAAAGPIEEQTDPILLFTGHIDLSTHFERCQLNLDWLCGVSRSILEGERWDLFMVQLHFVDWAHHILQGAIDPRHPLHDSSRAAEAEAQLRQFYHMADELVAVVAEAAGPEANLIVMGDHGQDLHHTTIRLNEWLAAEGLLRWADDGRTIDREHTLATAIGNGLYINCPEGTAQSAALIDSLVRRLLALRDPRTGERPVLLAGPADHFAFVGADGDSMGDVVFCLASGYQARNDRGTLFEITVPGREFTSGHDHFWPLDPRLYTRLYAAGPSIACAGPIAGPKSLIDVAPTVAALLGIPASPDVQGHPIAALLAGDAQHNWGPIVGGTA
jgi:predicted AlkP superfamily phosphohydrolase/phosphomutase